VCRLTLCSKMQICGKRVAIMKITTVVGTRSNSGKGATRETRALLHKHAGTLAGSSAAELPAEHEIHTMLSVFVTNTLVG